MICTRCSADIESGHTTEAQQKQAIIDWLCEVTCIKWRSSWLAQAASGCEQYGIVDFDSSSINVQVEKPKLHIYEHESETDEDGCPAIKKCEVVSLEEEVNITLIVKNDIGTTSGCDDTELTQNPNSALDVLRHIRAVTFSSHPKPDCIEFIDRANWLARNVHEEDKDGKVCGTHAEMNITVNFCQKYSVPVDVNIYSTCLIASCDGVVQDLCKSDPDCN